MKSKFAIFAFSSLLCLAGEVYGQNTYTYSGTNGAAWIRASNWTGGVLNKYPGVDNYASTTGDGNVGDTASFVTSSTVTSVGINFNGTGSNNGVTANGNANQALALGAITFAPGASAGNFTVNNSSTTLDGVLTLNSATIGSDSNVILKNTSANILTLTNGSQKTMGIALGNSTDNSVIIAGAGNIVITSNISGASKNLSLSASGIGALVLGGTNTYTGVTTINAGILSVTGSLASGSAVTINNTGTLAGSGTVNGTVAVQSDGVVGAGNAAIGTLTTGAATFNNGSIFSWDLAAAGTTYDKMRTPSLTDGGAAGGSIFKIVAADTTFSNVFWNTSRTFADIFTTDGSTAIANWATIFSSVSVVNSSFNPVDISSKGAFSATGNTLNWTAVPEPSSALAGLLLGAGLLRRNRSQRA